MLTFFWGFGDGKCGGILMAYHDGFYGYQFGSIREYQRVYFTEEYADTLYQRVNCYIILYPMKQ